MSLYKDPKIRRKIIMDHYLNPKHKVESIKNGIDIYSDVCNDELHLGLKINENKIVDAKFSGQGCAIFLASVDIMIGLVINKSLNEVKNILESYNNMIKQEGEYKNEVLGDLLVFENVSKHLNRLHCAEIIYQAFKGL